MAASSGNVICVVLAIAFLVIHTFLFTNLSDRLQLSLQRIDDLERLLQNATLQKFTRKTTSKSFLEVLERLLDPELDRDEGHVKSRRLLRKIRHLESRLKRCAVRSLRNKRYLDDSRSLGSHESSERKQYALYTIWGVVRCPANSKFVYSGQMVTTDGSDYLCLSDDPIDPAMRKKKSRDLGSSVSLRGVTYGDVEDVVNFFTKYPPSGKHTRNNKTVPCALCARRGKSSSKMIVAINNFTKIRNFNVQREYYGVLMSTKHSKKLICLSADAKEYKRNNRSPKVSLSETIQLHPAELRCNSMHCEDDRNYEEGFRVRCVVVTF